ncbi:RNA polymerase I-specific transcription initiation factor RRN3 isoform X1 [Ahaetulla prasina]|uniref:RNA polymerase I-specific transcription initiation factor RRN3 isoform X1 n=1 Tax=Ahaetulla prasina TaxID=499056 RepID=UPI0026476F5E|nr:RNA polymerase I-specific transcription initiation factor RRN3 isoform X1 [Ahaetulla prasina]XP_058013552.1 RNA polymerase I-specific transcription initiation factor RRN3 isoform X1 [Ahaetulla prasina]
MLAEDEFLRSPPRKTVRFGGTLAEILLKYKQGKTTEFDLLKHQLLDPDIKDDQIINWLSEFRSSITFLTKEFEQLITILLKVPWLRRSQPVVEEYLAFLSNLVSAQTIYLRPCLQMIVSHFVPPRITIRENDVDISDSDDDENVVESFTTCHRALQTIVKYVPLTPQFLMPVLVEKFPFINKSERTLQCYLHNLLRISVYIPSLRHDILELVVEKLLKIDVSAPKKDIEAAEEDEERNSEKGLFNMDEDGENAEKSDIMAHPIAERLDILMIVMFSYIKDVCYVNGKIDVGNTKDLYRDLVAIFDKLILTTHGSCHVQFIMFYLCGFRLVIAEAFVEHLWKKLQNPNIPAVIRQTTGNYIGSFLARAKFIPIVTVKACLDLLVSWLHTYIDNQGTGSRAFCDVALHGPFYAACQAVFYIVIFRHKQLLDGNLKKGEQKFARQGEEESIPLIFCFQGLAYLQSLNFERIVLCQLNPLKVCLPTIVSLFAALTRKYQVAFCDTIIERNRRQILPVVRSSCGGESVETATNPLDSFFPFDPYILKKSKNTINPLYQFWEEQSAEDLKETAEPINEGKGEEEDDFLRGETPQNDGMISVTPSSFNALVHNSETSLGSSPS